MDGVRGVMEPVSSNAAQPCCLEEHNSGGDSGAPPAGSILTGVRAVPPGAGPAATGAVIGFLRDEIALVSSLLAGIAAALSREIGILATDPAGSAAPVGRMMAAVQGEDLAQQQLRDVDAALDALGATLTALNTRPDAADAELAARVAAGLQLGATQLRWAKRLGHGRPAAGPAMDPTPAGPSCGEVDLF